MQSKITTTLLIASILGLMACTENKKSSVITNASLQQLTEGEAKQTADVNLVKDSFESQGLVDDLIKEGKISLDDIENEGCDENMGKLDPQVKIGDRVLSKTLRASQNGQQESLSANTIQLLSETKSESLIETLSINISSPALGEILAKPYREKSVCDDEQDGCVNFPIDSVTESLTPAALSYFDSHDSDPTVSCYLKEEIEDSSTREFGIYTLSSGKKIKATRTIRTAHGRAACEMSKGSSHNNVIIEVGAGEIRSIVIRSNEISPGLTKYFCGGAPIVYGSTVKAESKVIQSERTEQITPVLRN